MAEYIDRQVAIALAKDIIVPTKNGYDYRHRCIDPQDLAELPAADVRPVVLCRDCKWCHAGYCEKYDDLIPFGCAYKPWEDWFCADGKKREES